jgi:hypothetical protein
MILYLYGPDSYRRQQRLNWYIEKFKEKHSALTVESFDLENSDELVRLRDFSVAQSLFVDFKFGILNNLDQAEPKELESVFKLATDAKSLTLAISSDKRLPKEFKALNGKGVTKEDFSDVSEADLMPFIQNEAITRNIKISPAQAKALAQNHNGDTWAIITELDKLALGGSLEPLQRQEDFFLLLNRIPRGDLAALSRLLESEDPAKIFNILSAQKNPAWKTKMADYDVAIKSGKLDYAEALLELVVS